MPRRRKKKLHAKKRKKRPNRRRATRRQANLKCGKGYILFYNEHNLPKCFKKPLNVSEKKFLTKLAKERGMSLYEFLDKKPRDAVRARVVAQITKNDLLAKEEFKKYLKVEAIMDRASKEVAKKMNISVAALDELSYEMAKKNKVSPKDMAVAQGTPRLWGRIVRASKKVLRWFGRAYNRITKFIAYLLVDVGIFMLKNPLAVYVVHTFVCRVYYKTKQNFEPIYLDAGLQDLSPTLQKLVHMAPTLTAAFADSNNGQKFAQDFMKSMYDYLPENMRDSAEDIQAFAKQAYIQCQHSTWLDCLASFVQPLVTYGGSGFAAISTMVGGATLESMQLWLVQMLSKFGITSVGSGVAASFGVLTIIKIIYDIVKYIQLLRKTTKSLKNIENNPIATIAKFRAFYDLFFVQGCSRERVVRVYNGWKATLYNTKWSRLAELAIISAAELRSNPALIEAYENLKPVLKRLQEKAIDKAIDNIPEYQELKKKMSVVIGSGAKYGKSMYTLVAANPAVVLGGVLVAAVVLGATYRFFTMPSEKESQKSCPVYAKFDDSVRKIMNAQKARYDWGAKALKVPGFIGRFLGYKSKMCYYVKCFKSGPKEYLHNVIHMHLPRRVVRKGTNYAGRSTFNVSAVGVTSLTNNGWRFNLQFGISGRQSSYEKLRMFKARGESYRNTLHEVKGLLNYDVDQKYVAFVEENKEMFKNVAMQLQTKLYKNKHNIVFDALLRFVNEVNTWDDYIANNDISKLKARATNTLLMSQVEQHLVDNKKGQQAGYNILNSWLNCPDQTAYCWELRKEPKAQKYLLFKYHAKPKVIGGYSCHRIKSLSDFYKVVLIYEGIPIHFRITAIRKSINSRPNKNVNTGTNCWRHGFCEMTTDIKNHRHAMFYNILNKTLYEPHRLNMPNDYTHDRKHIFKNGIATAKPDATNMFLQLTPGLDTQFKELLDFRKRLYVYNSHESPFPLIARDGDTKNKTYKTFSNTFKFYAIEIYPVS